MKIRNLVFILIGLIVVLFVVSIYEEITYVEDYEYVEDYSYQEVEDTSIASWMVGTWKGKLDNGYMQLYWSLDIDEYGNAKQIIYNPQGGSEVELLSLKYNRKSDQLYYKEGGMTVTIQVDSYNKTLSLPSSSGTLYLHKEY